MINITRDYEPTFLEHDTERFEEIYDDSPTSNGPHA